MLLCPALCPTTPLAPWGLFVTLPCKGLPHPAKKGRQKGVPPLTMAVALAVAVAMVDKDAVAVVVGVEGARPQQQQQHP